MKRPRLVSELRVRSGSNSRSNSVDARSVRFVAQAAAVQRETETYHAISLCHLFNGHLCQLVCFFA